MTRFPLLLLLTCPLIGCPEGDDDDSAAQADDDDSAAQVEGQTHAVVVTTDFAVGALATVELDTLDVTDEITATSGDAVVRADCGYVFVINRYQHDSVRVYDPDDLVNPLVEFSTGAGSNPQDVGCCGDELFVTRLEETSIGIYDLDTGMPVGEVDLSEFADDDGTPEAATMARIGDTLYVALQRLDRSDTVWLPAPDGGRVVEIDCESREVTDSWATASNVSVQPHGARPDALLLFDGVYYDEDWMVALDGGVRELDPSLDEVDDYRLEEADLGGNVVGVCTTGTGQGLLVTAEDQGHRVMCFDTDGWTPWEAAFTTGYVPEVACSDTGLAFIPVRSWIDPYLSGGMMVYDVAECADLTAGGWLTFGLEPFSAAFF